jgi:hypothetical protein
MGRPPTVGLKVTADLTEYLNKCQSEFNALPDGSKVPTLPTTPDGKVNVRAIAKAIGLTVNQEKYLYDRPELTQLINLVCEGQEVLPIGSRVTMSAADKALKERLARQAKASQEASQAAVEADSALHAALDRVRELSDELEAATAQITRLRAQLQSIEDGIYSPVDD